MLLQYPFAHLQLNCSITHQKKLKNYQFNIFKSQWSKIRGNTICYHVRTFCSGKWKFISDLTIRKHLFKTVRYSITWSQWNTWHYIFQYPNNFSFNNTFFCNIIVHVIHVCSTMFVRKAYGFLSFKKSTRCFLTFY